MAYWQVNEGPFMLWGCLARCLTNDACYNQTEPWFPCTTRACLALHLIFGQACKLLLGAGAPLDSKASSGGTALMFAAAAGYTDVVKLLLARGADMNAKVEVRVGSCGRRGFDHDARGAEQDISSSSVEVVLNVFRTC